MSAFVRTVVSFESQIDIWTKRLKDKTVARDRVGVRFAFIIMSETFDTLFPFSLTALAAGRPWPRLFVSVDFVVLMSPLCRE